MDENNSVMEEIEIPSDFVLSELNFSNRLFDDDMPLMPSMGAFEERFSTFKTILKDTSKECRDLAKLGFYCCETPDFFITHGSPSFLKGKVVTGMNEEKREEVIAALCFCCGYEIMLNHLHTPRFQPIVHHLSCTFFKIPMEKKHIKDSIKPYRGWQDVDLKHWNNVRAELFGKVDEVDMETAKKMFDEPTPLCENCNINEQAVRFLPCGHKGYCTFCAKAKSTCLKCMQRYHGLSRVI